MAGEQAKPAASGGYVVLHETEPGRWEFVGDVDRRAGLTARNSRVQAVRDALGREPADSEVYAAIPRSEWRVAKQL